MKKLELKQMELIEGGKFWGWGDVVCGACDGTGHQSCAQNHYILWIVDTTNYTYTSCNIN